MFFSPVVIRSACLTCSAFPCLGMWRFGDKRNGFPLMLRYPSTIRIWDRRAGVLICYEQLLVWPALHTLSRNPDMLLAPQTCTGLPARPFHLSSTSPLKTGQTFGAIPFIRGQQPMKTFPLMTLLLLQHPALAQNTDIIRLQSTCIPTAPLEYASRRHSG